MASFVRLNIKVLKTNFINKFSGHWIKSGIVLVVWCIWRTLTVERMLDYCAGKLKFSSSDLCQSSLSRYYRIQKLIQSSGLKFRLLDSLNKITKTIKKGNIIIFGFRIFCCVIASFLSPVSLWCNNSWSGSIGQN